MERSIDASTTLTAALARVREILLDDPATALSDTCTDEIRQPQRVRAHLAVEVSGGASLQQEVEIQIGVARSTRRGGIAVPITWAPTAHHKLIPSFDGDLEASPDRSGTILWLRGTYDVPPGPLGRFGDGVAGRQLARHSLATFLEEIARRLDVEVDRRVHSRPDPTAAHTVAIHERSAGS